MQMKIKTAVTSAGDPLRASRDACLDALKRVRKYAYGARIEQAPEALLEILRDVECVITHEEDHDDV